MSPHGVSKRHSKKIGNDSCIVLDAFTGIGGDLLHLQKCVFSVGCEIDSRRIETAKSLHGQLAKNSSDFILCDSLRGKSCFRGHCFDFVYLSPPWGYSGARNRREAPVFGNRRLASLELDGFLVFKRAQQLAKGNSIAFYLPRGMAVWEIQTLASETQGPVLVDVHVSYDPDDEVVKPKHKYKVRAVTAYFGELAKGP